MKFDNCNPFAGAKVPPCSEFLGSSNPIIKDGQLIFRNNNRVFYFISTSSTSTIHYNACSNTDNTCNNTDNTGDSAGSNTGNKTGDNAGSKSCGNTGNKTGDSAGSKSCGNTGNTSDNDGSKSCSNTGNTSDNDGSKSCSNTGNKTGDSAGSKSCGNTGNKTGDSAGSNDDNKSEKNASNNANSNTGNNAGCNSSSNSGNGSSLGSISTVTNLQISLTTYIVGLYIHEVQLGNILHCEKNKIHSDKKANDFINKTLKKNPIISVDYTPSLSLVVSNSNAILNAFTNTINITPLNYYILFVLNRLENHPGLFFGNNSYVTEDSINFTLASMALRFPCE